jgi:hypothetical protein
MVARRSLVTGAVWATPALLVAVAAPAAAASAGCAPARLVADWTSASYVRTGPTMGVYTWVDPLGNRSIPVLTLTVSASVVNPAYSGLRAADLTGTAGPTGGSSAPGLELALALLQSTTSSTVTGADYTFTFSRPVTNLAFAVTDIDGTGFNASTNSSGAERVSLSGGPISGAVANASYLTGGGTVADPWRRRPNSSPSLADLPSSLNAGNVDVSAATLAAFTLSYRLLDNTSTPGTPYSIWLTPFTFTLLCP